MNKIKTYVLPDSKTFEPVTIDPKKCTGCNICVELCQVDLFLPNPEKLKPPIVFFRGECWYDGTCVSACPEPGAIRLNTQPKDKVSWKDKTTGKISGL
ncbi:ferredoxin family protein [candidate division KSB1 bacterium]